MYRVVPRFIPSAFEGCQFTSTAWMLLTATRRRYGKEIRSLVVKKEAILRQANSIKAFGP
jgi:hypothetical protein